MDISLDDLKQILTEGRLRVNLQGATCIHCSLVLPTVDAAKEHDAVCEKHPLVTKLAALERELAEARKPCPCKVRDAAIDAAMGGE